MTAAVDAAYTAALADVTRLFATPGAANPESVTTAATAAVVHSLAMAGCLTEPQAQAPELTLEDAARLLCELSCSVLLSDPDEDYVQLLDRPDRVKYAWDQAVGAGIPPADRSRAEEARRLLLTHHRGGPQS